MCMCDWALFAKSILLMDILQLYSFHTDKVAIDARSDFPDGRFVGVNYTQSCETAY